MLKKDNRLRKNNDFTNVYKRGKSCANRDFVIFYKKNNKECMRVGFSISKKIGKAHHRNLIKRRLREIVNSDKEFLSKKYDVIILVRKNIKSIEYEDLKRSMYHALKRSDLHVD